LVEAIIVMVLTGVLAGVMVLFIRQPVQNYVDAAGRAGLTDTADLALRRMARELRSALPNSIRTTFNNGVWYVQFIPVRSGGQYLAVEDSTTGGIPLSFTSMSATQFDVVGPMPDVVPGDIIAIYNLGNEIIDADAYYVQEAPPTNTNQVNRQQVSAVSGTGLRWQTTPSFRRTCHQRTHAEYLARTSLPRDRHTGHLPCEGGPLAGNAQALLEHGFRAPRTHPGGNTPNALMAANVHACRFSVMQNGKPAHRADWHLVAGAQQHRRRRQRAGDGHAGAANSRGQHAMKALRETGRRRHSHRHFPAGGAGRVGVAVVTLTARSNPALAGHAGTACLSRRRGGHRVGAVSPPSARVAAPTFGTGAGACR
jgi:MSHA biogenesis protein MshO